MVFFTICKYFIIRKISLVIPVNLSDPHGRRSPAIQNEKAGDLKRDDYFELKILVNEKNKHMIQTLSLLYIYV